MSRFFSPLFFRVIERFGRFVIPFVVISSLLIVIFFFSFFFGKTISNNIAVQRWLPHFNIVFRTYFAPIFVGLPINTHIHKNEKNVFKKKVYQSSLYEYIYKQSNESEYDQVLKWNVPCKQPKKCCYIPLDMAKWFYFKMVTKNTGFIWSLFLFLHRFRWTKSIHHES